MQSCDNRTEKAHDDGKARVGRKKAQAPIGDWRCYRPFGMTAMRRCYAVQAGPNVAHVDNRIFSIFRLGAGWRDQ
jgi:hypothetical protein